MTPREIREKIIDTVASNGGHLSSSLGAVELSVALAKVFDPVKDRIVWDVGHQAYAWKILTGRADAFSTLRRFGGISGFPNPAESPCDAATAGHAGVALSVAEGYSAARDLTGETYHSVAVVGDASIVNGTCFEAINNLAAAARKTILVLNDNGMAISKPAGSFSRFLGRLISGVRYNRVKKAAENAGHAMRLTFLRGAYHGLETRVKSLFLGNRFFEQFGLRYIGPVDGHDVDALVDALTVAKEDKRSVLLHVVTKKGKGYAPAELHPTLWHGTGPFDRAKGEPPAGSGGTWSDIAGETLCSLAGGDGRVVALTAAMADGTGLAAFRDRFPARFFDTGISEGHAVAFAGGLAAGGARPFVAIYSTFLQRAVDQIFHDVCLARRNVVFLVDRAGIVGADGATHHGIYDVAMLRCLPNIEIWQPSDAEDLRRMMKDALAHQGPVAIRYPRGRPPVPRPEAPKAGGGAKFALWATPDWMDKAREAAALAGGEAFAARRIKPFDLDAVAEQRAKGMKIATLENCALAGGIGEAIGADWRFGWPDAPVPHGSCSELEKAYGLDAASVAASIKERMERDG